MALSFNTVEALSISALEGQGIVQQLDLLVGGYIAEGRLVELLRDYSCEGPPLSVVYPRATQHLAKVRVFAEFAADLMRNYEARMRRRESRCALSPRRASGAGGACAPAAMPQDRNSKSSICEGLRTRNPCA